MLEVIAILVVVLVAGVLTYAATRPDTFRVQRSTTINLPPERVFPLVDDFHEWASWSPWEKLDPAMNRTFGGAASGVGATYAWEGNKKVGTGRMEIQQSSPSSRVVVKLDFLKPFEAHNTADFTFEPVGASTQLTWAMYGPSPYMMKVMGIFMNMEAMVGKDFEAGLANLKSVAETRAVPAALG